MLKSEIIAQDRENTMVSLGVVCVCVSVCTPETKQGKEILHLSSTSYVSVILHTLSLYQVCIIIIFTLQTM